MYDVALSSWMALAVLVAIVLALLKDVARPDVIFLSGLGALLFTGVITPQEAFSGFSNTAVLAVGALFVVAAGIEETGALRTFDRFLFGSASDLRWALPRIMIPTACLSSFISNTPIVAILAPRVRHWAQRMGIAPSKVLIPLSYASIAGGMVTLIGTSTNIIVSGLMVDAGLPGFGLFDPTLIGLATVVCVAGFFFTVGHRLLPDRGMGPVRDDDLLECLFEVCVGSRASMIGKTVEEAGLRALGDAYLVSITRHDHQLLGDPTVVLACDDRLTFSGKPSMLEKLLQRRGLEPGIPLADAGLSRIRPLFEAVVSETSNLVGKSLREARFREQYGGVVLAIQRRSERIEGPLGRVPIKSGDLLVLEANAGFDDHWNASRTEFYMVTPRRGDQTKRLDRKAPVALVILGVMIALIGVNLLPVVTAAFMAAMAMVITGCLDMTMARRALNLEVLVLIAAALGVGEAIANTGVADYVATILLGLSDFGILAMLMGLYLFTNILTELITHKAAAVLMLPVALAMASATGVEPKALALIITVAAAASFMTPVGYHTNLMVMAVGDYRVRDYLKVGLPVSLIVMVVTTILIFFTWV